MYEVTFKASSFLLVNIANSPFKFEPVAKSRAENFHPHEKFPIVWIPVENLPNNGKCDDTCKCFYTALLSGC